MINLKDSMVAVINVALNPKSISATCFTFFLPNVKRKKTNN